MDDQLYFVGQKAFIEKGGKVLILIDPEMGVDLPGGKLQEGETDVSEALKREVMEETGLGIEIGKPFVTWMYQIPVGSSHRSAGKLIFNIGYRCRFLSGEVHLSPEHTSYQWVGKEEYATVAKNSGFLKGLESFFTEGSI
jgi:8-oxo-dGTP pyrophosphatase MutT (NUDIX family)